MRQTKTLAIYMMLSSLGCMHPPRSVGPTREQAIADAKLYMLTASTQVKGHVQVRGDKIRVVRAIQNVDGGWDLTLQEGECIHMIYANPGVSIENEGINSACLRGR